MAVQRFAAPTVSDVQDFDDRIRRREHDGFGFLVSMSSPGGAVLHRAGCTRNEVSRMVDEDGPIAKVCSTDRFALAEWARENRVELKHHDCV